MSNSYIRISYNTSLNDKNVIVFGFFIYPIITLQTHSWGFVKQDISAVIFFIFDILFVSDILLIFFNFDCPVLSELLCIFIKATGVIFDVFGNKHLL
jgi:hypothetical protein